MERAFVVAGLGYGDEGKGATVDYLVRRYKATAVVRYNGGSQASHNVVTRSGRHHDFSQYGSGTFAAASTFLSRHVIVNPLNMMKEGAALRQKHCTPVPVIDESALIATPYQIAVNRLAEWSRGASRHGSCGQGIGQTKEHSLRCPKLVIRVEDCAAPNLLEDKLRSLRGICRGDAVHYIGQLEQYLQLHSPGEHEMQSVVNLLDVGDTLLKALVEKYLLWYRSWCTPVPTDRFCNLLGLHKQVVFEGAQGVLLDETYGEAPYNTWSNIRFDNAMEIMQESSPLCPVVRVGVLRSYFTRHGPGPFPTESVYLTGMLPDPHNQAGVYQGDFRVGHFDAVAARYAVEVCGGVDELFITNLDRHSAGMVLIGKEERRGLIYLAYGEPERYLASLEEHVGVPITNVSYGPTAGGRKERVPCAKQPAANSPRPGLPGGTAVAAGKL